MSNGAERPEQPERSTGHDPWAPPEHRTPPGPPQNGQPGQSGQRHEPWGGAPDAPRPQPTVPNGPSVADQQTVTSMPAAGAAPPPGAAGYGQGPAAQPPAAQTPYAQAPYGSAPYGGTSYGAPSYATGYGTGAYPAAQPGGPAPLTPFPGGPGWAAAGLPPKNGLGTAGMVLGIIGACFTATIVGFVLGLIIGVLAIIFGAIGRTRARKGEATNGGQALSGLILGAVAVVGAAAVLIAVVIEVANAPGPQEPYKGGGDTYNAGPPAVVRVLPPAR